MRILFLGGTSFVGRHLAHAAIAAKHDVTFFHRGLTNPSLFPNHQHLRGDRYADVSALERIAADAVIDTSGYTPDSVAATARAVANRVRKYLFMSSVDVYDDLGAPTIAESSATKQLSAAASTAQPVPELYGAHKARCEQILVTLLGAARVISVRAGLMVGPHDTTGRFTYWPVRQARGGEILAPVGTTLPLQIIDVRDVAQWSIAALAADLHGTFNLVGMPGSLTFGDLVDVCRRVAPNDARFTWVTSAFLEANDVRPWIDMPLWLPDIDALTNFCRIRNDRAHASGLRLRPLIETVHDILADYGSQPGPRTLRAGISPEREWMLLQAWHARA